LLTTLAGLIVVALSRPPSPVGWEAMREWSLADLTRHMASKGLRLRPVPTAWRGRIGQNAFLAARERAWEELNRLPKDPAEIGRWSGVVYCERVTGAGTLDEEKESWGGRVLEIGPFAFFGDPDLLARIRAALPDEPS
jgi:hypothetical protein